MEQPTTQCGRLAIYPCLQKTIEQTSKEPTICTIKIVIKTDSKRSIVTCELYFYNNKIVKFVHQICVFCQIQTTINY